MNTQTLAKLNDAVLAVAELGAHVAAQPDPESVDLNLACADFIDRLRIILPWIPELQRDDE